MLLGVREESGVDDRQFVMTLQEDLCILSNEVIWVGDEKKNYMVWESIGKNGANKGFI